MTHVVFPAKVNFIGEYYRLLHPHAPLEDGRNSLGYRLGAKLPLPRWLQPIPYRPPPELTDASPIVRLFKVAFDQTERERLYHTALAQLADGEVLAAEESLAAAVAQAPVAAHASLHATAGAAFYGYGADAAAVRLFRRALAPASDPAVAKTVAWILATSRDDSLRNGRAALALVEPIVQRDPNDPALLSTLAAAHAELGRFPEALPAAERALTLVRTAGDLEAAALLQRRLETYRAQKPWRQ